MVMPPEDRRNDLAGLSDSELIARIEGAWQAYEKIEESKTPALRLSLLNGPGHFPALHSSLYLEPAIDAHRTLREIRELTDELERRMNSRKENRV